MSSPILLDTCRFCGCTSIDACVLAGGRTCDWLDEQRTVCTSPRCVSAYIRTLGRSQMAELIWARVACDYNCSIEQAKRRLTPREAAAAITHHLIHSPPPLETLIGGGA